VPGQRTASRAAGPFHPPTRSAPAAGEPQHQSRQGNQPQPRRGQLAVDAPGLAEVQARVQTRQPRAERQRATGAIGNQFAGDLGVAWIHEHSKAFRLTEPGHVEQHPGRVSRPGRRAYGEQRALRLTLPGSRHLVADRHRRTRALDGDRVPVERVLDLRGQSVEEPGQRRQEEERADQDPRIEVQSDQQRPNAATSHRLFRSRHRTPLRDGASTIRNTQSLWRASVAPEHHPNCRHISLCSPQPPRPVRPTHRRPYSHFQV